MAGSGPDRNVSITIRAKNEASKALIAVGESLASLAGISATAAATVAGLAYTYTKITTAAAEQEKASVRLAISLASVGNNSAGARAHLEQFIAGLENVTATSDETIAGVVSLFTQLGRLSGDALERATKAALDYAAATGEDVTGATTQMVNVLVRGSGRLKGINTDFADGATNAEKFAQVQRQIEEQMGGTAAAMGKTLSAALQRIANDYDNMQQAAGEFIVESEGVRGVLTLIADAFKGASRFATEHKDLLRSIADLAARAGIIILRTATQLAVYEAKHIDATLALGQYAVGLATLASIAPALSQKIFGVGGEQAAEWAKSMAKVLGVMQTLRDGAQSLATAGEDGIGRINELLEGLGKSTTPAHDVAAGIRNIGKGATETIGPLAAFDELMKKLGGTTLQDMRQATLEVDQALQMLMDLQRQGLITPEEWDAALAAITAITEQLPSWTTNTAAANQQFGQLNTQAEKMTDSIAGALTDATFSFGDALIDTAMGAKIAWGQFFRQLLADLLKALVRAMLFDKIFSVFRIGMGSSSMAAASGLGQTLSNGNIFESAAGMFPPVRMPSPGATLDPGTLSTLQAPASAAAALRPGVTITNTIVPQRDRFAEAIDIVDAINTLVERRGYRLVASQVTG